MAPVRIPPIPWNACPVASPANSSNGPTMNPWDFAYTGVMELICEPSSSKTHVRMPSRWTYARLAGPNQRACESSFQ